jgi:hypothetical protein
MNKQRGVALILAILVTSFLSAIGLGLAMIVLLDQFATSNLRGSVGMLYAADAALELALRDLARIADWNLVLTGDMRGSVFDGPPGVRTIPGGSVLNLSAAANQLNCGRSAGCSDAQLDANTRERPWGRNNARWRLFASGPLGNFVQFDRPVGSYVAVWVADDGREEDGDPTRDAIEDEPGHGVLRARVDAWGPSGTRRAIEAEIARVCLPAGEGCRMGTRVQSWRELRQSVP